MTFSNPPTPLKYGKFHTFFLNPSLTPFILYKKVLAKGRFQKKKKKKNGIFHTLGGGGGLKKSFSIKNKNKKNGLKMPKIALIFI